MSQLIVPGQSQSGTCSIFGGRSVMYGKDADGNGLPDPGMTSSEGVALHELSQVVGAVDPQGVPLFDLLPGHGLGHGLNALSLYCAMRWDYRVTPKAALRQARVQVCTVDANGRPGRCVLCRPVDWGPNEQGTRRLIDLSPGALVALGVETDAVVSATLMLSGA